MVLNLIDKGVIGWDEPDVMKVLNGVLKAGATQKGRQQRNAAPLKPAEQAPSARLTRAERELIPHIRFDLSQHSIKLERWELEALARGATVVYGDKEFSYVTADRWPGFN